MIMKGKVAPGYLFSKSYTNYIFILLFLLYMFDYVDRMMVNSMAEYIEREYNVNHTQSGLLLSVVLWSIVALTFPISIIVDRKSRTKTISIMAIFWSLATIACAFTGSFAQLVFARALIGIGEAGYAPGGVALLSAIYPEEKRAQQIGLWNAAIPIGSALGVVLGGYIANHYSWQHAFGLVAIPGLIIAILFYFVKDYKTAKIITTEGSEKNKFSVKDTIKDFASKPSYLYVTFGLAAILFVTTALINRLETFFQVTQNLDKDASSSMAGAVMVLALVGAPLGGFLTDKWRKKNPKARMLFPAVSSAFSAILLAIAINFEPGMPRYVIFLIFGVSVTAFGSAAVAVTQDVVQTGLRAVSYSIAVIIQNGIGAGSAPLVIGLLYDHYDIKTAFQILPFMLIIGAFLFYRGSRHYLQDMEKVKAAALVSA